MPPRAPAEVLADFRPHPITTEGRHTVVAFEGQTLDEAFRHRIPEWEPAVASVNGALVAREGWRDVTLREGDVVAVRVSVAGGEGSNPIAMILSIAVLVAAPYLAGGILGAGFGAFGAIVASETVAGALLTAAIGVGGLLIVNSLFPPRLPKPQDSGQPEPQYSISGGANRARPYEPLQLVLGTHRAFPDLAVREYTEFDEESDQYLNQIFDFGIGDLAVGALHIGETAFSNFENVETQRDVSRVTLVAGNVDTIPGGDLEHGAPLRRTTAADTTAVAFDLTAQHFRTLGNGSLDGRDTEIRVEWRENGTAGAWQSRDLVLVTPDGADARNAVRRSFKFATGRAAAWDVRATLLTEHDEEDDRLVFRATAAAFRAFQNDATDFSGRNPLAVRAKATGQLYGRLEAVNAVVSQRADRWDGARWVANEVTGNCGDVLLRYLRGWRIGGRLVAGMGLPDSRIDLPSIQGFAEHCTAEGLECNLVIEDGRDHAAALELICQCGWGAVDRQSGKWGVLWEDAGRPMTAIVTPANVIAGTMGLTYDNEGLADEVVGNFVDRTSDWQVNQIRRAVPGVDTPERPVEVPLHGITDGTHAAKELNRAVAAQFYHVRTITWEMKIDEGLAIARGDVVGASHGLIGAGAGGRLTAISADRRTLTLSRSVTADGHVWIWDLDDRVVARTYTRDDDQTITLAAALPPPPRGVEDDPHAYRFMAFAAEADLVRLRITGKEPAGEDRLRFIARDEVDAYYAHRTGDLAWNPLATSTASHVVPVGGFTVTQNGFGARIFAWSPHPDRSVAGYRIRYADANGAEAASWDTMTDLHEGLLTSSPLELVDRPAAGTWRFAIAAVLGDGRRTTPTFARAALGVPGERIANALWLFGAGEPAATLGEDGNLYLDTEDYTVWRKANGAWTKTADLSGTDGAAWHTGDALPAADLGADGDWYFRTANAGLYRKTAGAWAFQVDIDGEDGATWHSGPGIPGAALGKAGDFFFRTDQGYVYEKTDPATWTFRRDLTGPQGINGATWHTGNGVPAGGLGADGDLYFRMTDNTVWRKAGGSWSQISDLSGADGARWHTGPGAPRGSLGAVGDWYFRTSNAGIYRKTGNSTWTFQLDVDGEDGATWHSGPRAPSRSLGAVGDWYFRTSNGYVYEKTGTSTWTFRRDITGPQGPRGPQGQKGAKGDPGPGVSRSGLFDQIRISVTRTSGTTAPSVTAHNPGWRNLTSGPNGEARGEFYITSYTYSGP